MGRLKRKFIKFYNRDMPLYSVEYWYNGEAKGILEMTEGATHFTPLFVYRKGKGTSVYYDINNDDTALQPFIDYFKNNPKRFKELSKKYAELCEQLFALAKESSFDDFPKMFELILESWPMLAMVMVLGKVEDKNISNMAKAALALRKKYDEAVYTAGYKMYYLFIERYPKYKNYADFLTYTEIISGKLPTKKEIDLRKNGYFYLDGRLYFGKSVEEFTKENNIEIEIERITDIREIKGNTASRGKVIGRVKVLFEIKDMKKVNKGDILVTAMTTPDFVPAMEKASAFVTDEGGATCHAAIVAREMKKPCIVATKIGTSVLRDGDLIEVDADNGVVRVLERG